MNFFYRLQSNHFVKLTLLGLLLTWLVFIRWDIGSNSRLFTPENTQQAWLQPEAVDQDFPNLISPTQWSLDFSAIEKQVWQSQFLFVENKSKALPLSSETLVLLESISNEIQVPFSEAIQARFDSLLKRIIGPHRSEKLTSLLANYRHYQKDYLAVMSSLSQLSLTNRIKKLKTSYTEINQLQQHYFGKKDAEKLFENKNKTLFFLLNQQRINLDPEYNKEQRERHLKQLNEEYQQMLQSVSLSSDD